MRIFITGAAGFIGFYVAQAYLGAGHEVVGLDNLNAYYDPALKQARLSALSKHSAFCFVEADVADAAAVTRIFQDFQPQRVVHLAAQAGVRYSIENPQAYAQSNLIGFLNVLEACRRHPPEHLVFASSSSVYGLNAKLPFSEQDKTDAPASFYGATKKSNEVMAHSYAHLYGLAITGLRFFTVYGPWGRPDMAPFIFAKKIFEGATIDVFNNGKHARDFTYIDDIVEGVVRVTARIPQRVSGEGLSEARFKLYNIGNTTPVELMDFIRTMEEAIGKKARVNFLPMQQGDVLATYADITDIARDTGFAPKTPIEVGIPRFIDWYRDFYKVGSLI